MKNPIYLSLAVLSLLCVSATAFAQQKISGTITDQHGPVIGASVVQNGTSNGVVTDLNGTYKLSVPVNSTIIVSCIGYADQTAKITSDKSVYDFVLSEDAEYLDDVVVIGYQTVKRRDLTGAVSSVTGRDLAKVPVANAAQALQGKLSGVNIISQDGRPGASMSIRVRGGGSITQSNEPLVLMDGVSVGSLSDIPAENIESIDVLKDAASTAIYGARGANGVILVTTKGGKEGNATVTYNMYYQVKEAPKMMDVMDAYDYVYYDWSYGTDYGSSYGDGVARYFGLGSAYGNHLNDYKNVGVHNYINDILKVSNSWSHDLSLSGGTKTTKYYVSLNYLNDDGIRIQSGYNRWSFNAKLNQKIGKKWTADLDLRYNQSMKSGSNYGIATSAFRFRPVDNPLGTDNPALLGQGDGNVDETYNPYETITNAQSFSNNYKVRGTAGLSYNAFKGFTARTELSMNKGFSKSKDWDNGGATGAGYKVATLNRGESEGLRWSNTLNYTVQGLSKDHSINVIAGYEILTSNSEGSEIVGAGYPSGFTMDDAFGMINMTNVLKDWGKDSFSNTIDTPSNTISYFGRLNYSLKGRYLFTATFRADGSSKFAPNNRWGYFPAGAFAWRISDEPWMKESKSWIDDLKFRLSFGTSGADNISPSLWKETWTTSTATIDNQIVTTYVPGSMLSNPDLKWETTISRNAGFDFVLLKSKLRGSLELYWNTTKNILMQVPTDASSGYSYQMQNVGQTSNKGIELGLTAELVNTRDWGLSVNFNYSYNKNNVDAITANATVDYRTGWNSSMGYPAYDYVVRVGQPLGLVNGYKSLGYYTVDDFNYDAATGKYTLKAGIPDFSGILNYSSGVTKLAADGQNAFPGAAKYEDIDGNGTVTTDDATIIGVMQPNHTGGFSFNGNWKNLDFSANFSYQIGGKIYNANAMYAMMGNKDTGLGANRLSYVCDTWKAYNTDASGNLYLVTDPDELASLNSGTKYPVAFAEYGNVVSDFIEDASHLRLQTFTIGYTLPSKWMDFLKIQRVRVYATGGNLFCIDNYSGLDPDVNTRSSSTQPYYDYNAYPKSRNYTFGISVTF